jgi:flagellar basal-body rod protein FlgB
VTFQKELNDALARGDKDKLSSMSIRTEIDNRTKPIRLDGNNVELDIELLEMNRNTLNYQFVSEYIGGRIKTLNSAIKGQPS